MFLYFRVAVLGTNSQKMSLLGEGLQVDFLPGGTVVVNILVAKKIRRIRGFCREVTESFLLSQARQTVNSQGAINVECRIQGHQARLFACKVGFNRCALAADITCQINHPQKGRRAS